MESKDGLVLIHKLAFSPLLIRCLLTRLVNLKLILVIELVYYLKAFISVLVCCGQVEEKVDGPTYRLLHKKVKAHDMDVNTVQWSPTVNI